MHVIEDAGRLVRNKDADYVLSWAVRPPAEPGGRDRTVHWITCLRYARLEFAGGLVLLATRPMRTFEPLRRLDPPVRCVEFDLTADEQAARMRAVASEGYRRGEEGMTPDECGLVCEFVLRECDALGRTPDLRLLDVAFEAYQARRGGVRA